MNKYTLQILFSIILVNGLLLSLSLLGPDFTIKSPIDGEEFVISFPDVRESLFKSAQQNNENAENFLSKYDDSEEIEPETSTKDNGNEGLDDFLTNPETDGERALDIFFKALKNESESRVVRVAHYGDSQIEGDRITSYLREFFQKEFGGEGVGYVPVDDITDNVNYFRSTSGNWERYNVFNHGYSSGKYALSGLVFKYGNGKKEKKEDKGKDNGNDEQTTPEEDVKDEESPIEEKIEPEETIPPDTSGGSLFSSKNSFYLADSYNFLSSAKKQKPKKKKTASLRGSVTLNFGKAVKFSKIGVFYGKTGSNAQVKISDLKSGDEISTVGLEGGSQFGLKYVKYRGNGSTIRFDIRTGINPEIYGFFFDGNNGVQIDNLAIRGHSGDGLLKIDKNYLQAQYDDLNVKLIILQFGMNVMPTIHKESDLERVKKYYSNLFSGMKSRAKNASILVIGPGDMGVIRRGSNVSHPFIGRVVEIMKQCAIENGCAFWDTYHLMGGENSIAAWAQKGYAARDGHFINRGQKIIAAELFKGINGAYKEYLDRIKIN
ncbi:MAG: hypothetical protein IT278_09295 [Ignavibacteriaceae bacterium]|nr:hypothetical protein [Ignavibacteriaceae bacterium]